MENKYYTPELKEFCEGFEFERVVYGGHPPHEENNFHWNNNVFSFREDANEITYMFSAGMSKKGLRIKYLDKEDIESLGWEMNERGSKYGNRYQFDICGGFSPRNGLNGYWMSADKENNTIISINKVLANEFTIDGPKQYKVFEGTIKNKSELSRLMKQLGII